MLQDGRASPKPKMKCSSGTIMMINQATKPSLQPKRSKAAHLTSIIMASNHNSRIRIMLDLVRIHRVRQAATPTCNRKPVYASKASRDRIQAAKIGKHMTAMVVIWMFQSNKLNLCRTVALLQTMVTLASLISTWMEVHSRSNLSPCRRIYLT